MQSEFKKSSLQAPWMRSAVGMVAVFSFGSAAGVLAQQTAPPRLVLQALDTDQDGQLSAAEIAAAPRTLLTLDRNGDGQLTFDEVQPRPENAGASAGELVSQLMTFDKNGDGVLTADELPARMQAMFARGDANGDGRLTPDEIRAMASRQGMPAGTGSMGRGGPMRTDPLLSALDSDHDGVVSAAEIAAAGRSLLTLDKNGDGELSTEEIKPRQPTAEERANHLLSEFDTNKDGRISKAEAPDRMQQQFEAIDTDKDGFLERGELLQYFAAAAGAGQRGDGGGRPNAGGAGTQAGTQAGSQNGAQTGAPKEQK